MDADAMDDREVIGPAYVGVDIAGRGADYSVVNVLRRLEGGAILVEREFLVGPGERHTLRARIEAELTPAQAGAVLDDAGEAIDAGRAYDGFFTVPD